MIPAIQEIGFGPGTAKSYATLHQATVSLQEMGERTISTQVRIDGDVVPDFTGWELMFKGECFILPTTVPQATKDNTTRNSLVDLNFTSWIISELKRYYFVSLSQIDANTAIADKYKASVVLPIRQFVELFNRVLKYYFGDQVRMDLFNAEYSSEPVSVEINYTHIWDVLQKFYELFGVRWNIVVENGVYVIKVGFAADSIEDHDFEYGYQGGLLKFERQVQDENITNILLGRGGEKNLPYRYFKLQDPQNPEWEADPDAIPELANIYFDRLRDAAFRWYVRGWMQNPNRDTSWDATHTFPTYDSVPEEYQYAYDLGRTDAKFNPVEFVKDDASVEKYGERWGAQDDNDDIYPTIQGVKRDPIGRVDQVVDVSEITTDDTDAAAAEAATVRGVGGTLNITEFFQPNEQKTSVLHSGQFTIPSGSTGNLSFVWMNPISQDGAGIALVNINTSLSSVKAVNVETGVEYEPAPSGGLPAGTYYAEITVVVKNYNTSEGYSNVTYGLTSLNLSVSTLDTDSWKPTFDIWVKNIWNTEKAQGESDAAYATRVWEKILGDRVGNEAKVVFSDGFMSISEDYEFQIASYPVFDQSKSITVLEDGEYKTYQSEWKITLRKSDADFDATGKYVPSADGGKPAAGDHFFFTGIDMPFSYVEWAEETLHANKKSALDGLADIQPTWVITLDKVRVHTIEDADYGRALADRLAAGATVWIKDRRFTENSRLKLYVQSITYTWNEPSDGSPYLVPDIEVVLSDKVVDVDGPVAQIQSSVETIRTTYARATDVESIVRRVAEPLFLKKTGEADSSVSPTQFASKVTSKSFRQGDVGGEGWGFYTDTVQKTLRAQAQAQVQTRYTKSNKKLLGASEPEIPEESSSVLELDKLVVRKELRVNSLVANQIAYVGGRQINSAASIECTQVVDSDEGYYCYFNQKRGSVANLFVVGDFAMGQMFDPVNVEVRYYKARVDEVGQNYILLSKTVKDGAGAPEVGDVIVQHGHESNASRQYVIVRDVIGGGYERMLSGLNSVSAAGKEYYFAGRLAGQNPRWFVGDTAGEYAEWVNGRLNIKGTLIVRNSDGTYQAMTDYMSSVASSMEALQAQIDGQIQSWSSGEAPSEQTEPFPQVVDDVVDPSTANFPASGWTLSADREKHFGDIYVDDSTGQGYRYTKRLKNGVTEYYWTRITDEEVAEAMRLAQLANQGVAGLQYLKQATNGGTLVSGGLVLTSMIQLGQAAAGGAYNVWAGINGTIDDQLTNPMRSIAAWYGGPMVDHEADSTAASYAKSLFRMDGSGYLASGNIHWDQSGYGGIPGITWNGSDIIIGGNVKLASLTGDSVTELLSLVRELSGLIEKVNIGTQANPVYAVHVKDGMGFYSDSFVDAGGVGSGGGGGGGIDIDRLWQSLTNNPADQGYENTKIAIAHIPALPISGVIGLQSALDGKQATISDLATIRSNAASGATAYGWGNHASAGYLTSANGTAISQALQSLQSQVDSVATRDTFDELTATAFYADMAAVSILYAGAISLDGADLATSLSGLSTAIANEATARANAIAAEVTARNTAIANAVNALDSATEAVSSGYFLTGITITDGKITGRAQANSISGNAATATRLADNNAHYLWGVSYWESGVPQDVTAAPNLYIARTKVRASAANDTLLGVTAISNASSSGSTGDETRIEWDATNHAWHFYGGIYTDTFVVAGGEGSGGGGGSDIDLDRVWESLTNNTDKPDVKINLAHIPDIPWTNILSKPTTIAGYGIADAYTKTQVDSLIGAINQFHYEIAASTSAVTDPQSNVLYLIGPTGSGSDKYEEYVYANNTWTKIGDTSIDLAPYLTITVAAQTYQPIISDLATIRSNAEKGSTAYSDLTTVSAILQSLQSQVDSVASRDTFDELTATVFYSDVAAVSDLYVGAVSLGGVDLAGSLSSLSSRATNLESRATALEGRATSLEGRATTLEGYFTNGVANSALRLSGTAAYSIWGVEYWSSGVPKSVTGRPGLYIGTTQVQTSAASQDLNGIAAINATGLATIAGGIKLTTTKRIYFGDTDHYLELDSNGFHFSHGVYSEDFVTAGGIGSGGGGGSIDIDRLWQSLTNNPADSGYESTKIAQAHIPDMAATYGYLKGNQTITLTGVVAGSGTTSIATSIADGALSISKVSGLQAALDSKTGNTGTVTSVGLSVPTGLSVSGSPITTSGTLAITFASGYSIPTTAQQSAWSGKQDAISDLATIRSNAANGATAYSWGNHASAGYLTSANGTTISQALQSLQSQVDSVASRDMFDELTATVLHSDIVTASNAYFDAITAASANIASIAGSLSGNATTASYLVSASYGIGGGLNPIYFSGGRPVASTSTAGSASVPVYLNGGTLTAITPSSLFSALSSSAATNLSVTIAGQVRTIADLYARYDKDGGEIAPNMTTIGTALRSLQSQVDSVASRDRFDELNATVLFTDMLSVGGDAMVGGLATIAGGIKLTTTKKIWFNDTVYIELDSNGRLHTNAGFYSDSFITAGA